jgi:hypothetical protein
LNSKKLQGFKDWEPLYRRIEVAQTDALQELIRFWQQKSTKIELTTGENP